MFLNAIGIYTQEVVGDVTELKKIKYAQEDKSQPSNNRFFQTEPEQKPINQFKNIDTILNEEKKTEIDKSVLLTPKQKSELKFHFRMAVNCVHLIKTDEEYNYLYKISLNNNIYIFAISSKTEIDPTEKAFLFQNMQHILIRPDRVKATLDDVIANPLRFTGAEKDKEKDKSGDILIDKVHDDMREVIAIMQKNIELVIQRGEDLDSLKNKAIDLNKRAINFENRAKKMNSCCW